MPDVGTAKFYEILNLAIIEACEQLRWLEAKRNGLIEVRPEVIGQDEHGRGHQAAAGIGAASKATMDTSS